MKYYRKMEAKGLSRQTVWSYRQDKETIAAFAKWQRHQRERELTEQGGTNT